VDAARALGLDTRIMDISDLRFEEEFDGVFSNAVLHWIKAPDAVIEGVWRALVSGGRFVAECGGHGCVAMIVGALEASLRRRGIDPARVNPGYFPNVDEYGPRLERAGFTVRYIALIRRPTPLPGDILDWLETFAESFTAALASEERMPFLEEVRETLRPSLCNGERKWTADYVRLRFAADKK
jgi:SAM-dependent methyltransferase